MELPIQLYIEYGPAYKLDLGPYSMGVHIVCAIEYGAPIDIGSRVHIIYVL